ncbi:hypothetical protein CKY20_08320 [Capnocytophaga canis]|uniref:Lipoprotein n=1 Tax=Capnocytophaga canis TaxID=1848903 RepID=A0A3A1YIR5_9FLAO|nr:hypothetical protein [Capnocytophaga canis]RIY36134.1 hypothetical protein CKY20_08320 [Capnocytophaga canis]
MKKILFLASIWLMIIGCSGSKIEDDPEGVIISNGKIVDMGNPASDGCGWLIEINGIYFAMDGFDNQFQTNGLYVKVSYLHTKFHYLCGRGGKPFSVIKIIRMDKM